MPVHPRYKKDPNTNRLQAAFWATSRMQDLAQSDVRFMSFDTTHCLNWQDMYTGMDGCCPPLEANTTWKIIMTPAHPLPPSHLVCTLHIHRHFCDGERPWGYRGTRVLCAGQVHTYQQNPYDCFLVSVHAVPSPPGHLRHPCLITGLCRLIKTKNHSSGSLTHSRP